MGTRILTVDDEQTNLRLFQSMIHKYMPDADIRAAEGGHAALSAVKEFLPDIILLDARMPDLDGFEVCRRVKTDPATADTPVLMVSGAYIDAGHRVSGFEGGADAYICKPFKPQELIAQIKALLVEKKEKEAVFRVMVVDDSLISRQVVSSELKRSPYTEIAAFDSAAAGLAALDAVKPDLVVADAAMPGMDGYAFCAELRRHPDYQGVPIVLLSEELNSEVREKAAAHGVTDIFPKPFRPTELAQYMDQHMSVRRDWFDHDVLVVDGDLATRKTLRQYLAGMRLRVHEAESVEAARQVLDRVTVDLIILGDEFSGKSGLEWCGELRATEDHRWVPILGLPADGRQGVAFIQAGADDYLSRELIKEEIEIRAKNLLKRVTLTQQLNTALQRERELNEHRNRLLGIAAHDIRSPLNAISHFAESLISMRIDDREFLMHRIRTIHTIARQARDMLNGILDVASIQSGTVALKTEDFRLDELVAGRVAFMNEVGEGKKTHGEFVNRVPGEGEAPCRGDRQRLSQVIDNLLGNIIKYCPEHSAFEVTLEREVEGWVVRVCDNGPGIPKDELIGIFDEFGKTSVQATGGEKSTGLGLAIAKKLVELHGGTIWIDSAVGKGTTVSFVLPRNV